MTALRADQELTQVPAEPGKGLLPSRCSTVCLQLASKSAGAERQAALSWSFVGLLQGGRRSALFLGFCRAEGGLAAKNFTLDAPKGFNIGLPAFQVDVSAEQHRQWFVTMIFCIPWYCLQVQQVNG